MNTETQTITPTIDAEVVEKKEVTIARNAPFINEQGDVNLGALTPQQIDKCRQITKNLSPNAVGSVSNYGVELQTRLANSGKSFLADAKTSRSGEVGAIMSDLVSTLDQINIKDLKEPNAMVRFLQKVPVVNHFVPNIKKVLAKYQTIEDSIATIEENIKATQLSAIADNNNLQVMFDENRTYVTQLESIIVAGTLAIDDAKQRLLKLQQEGADSITVSDEQDFINSLEKKVHDLKSVRLIAKQNLMQIRVIQRNNIVSAENAQSMITMTVPVFRTQMSLAVALQHQYDNNKVQKTVREKTDEILKANAEALYHNSVEITKQANASIISADALRESSEKMHNTIAEIRKIQQEAYETRKKESIELAKIEHNIDSLIGASVGQIDTAAKGINLLD